MMRLQGMNPEGFVQKVSDAQLGKQIGNAMSVNVLERIFVRLLPAAGLYPARSLRDRWAKVIELDAPAPVEVEDEDQELVLVDDSDSETDLEVVSAVLPFKRKAMEGPE